MAGHDIPAGQALLGSGAHVVSVVDCLTGRDGLSRGVVGSLFGGLAEGPIGKGRDVIRYRPVGNDDSVVDIRGAGQIAVGPGDGPVLDVQAHFVADQGNLDFAAGALRDVFAGQPRAFDGGLDGASGMPFPYPA